MTQPIEIMINAVDNASPKLQRIAESMNVVGMELTRVFTMPVMALGRLVAANEEMAAALKPLQDAFQGIITQLARELIPIIRDLTPDLMDLSKTLVGLVHDIGPVLRELTPTLKALVEEIAKFAKVFNALSPETKKSIIDMILLGAALGPVLVGVGQALMAVSKLGTLFSTLASITPGLGSAMTAVGAVIGGITLPVTALIAAIGLLAITIYEFGPQAWETITYLGKIVDIVFRRMVEEITVFIRSIITINWPELGRNIIIGISNGVVSAGNQLSAALQAVVNNAITAAKETLGIHSPSLVFHGIGQNMMAGMSNGITDNAPAAVGATHKAVSAGTVSGNNTHSINIQNLNIGAGANNMGRNDMQAMIGAALREVLGTK